MCDKCQSIINSLKAANSDKDAVIKHLACNLNQAEEHIKAQSALIDRAIEKLEGLAGCNI